MKTDIIISSLCMVLLFAVIGCNWDPPQQEESMPVAEDEVTGYWLCKTNDGVCLLDIRNNGKYRQVCCKNNQDVPFYDSGWQPWTFRPKRSSEATATITFSNVLDVSLGFSGNEFGKKYDFGDFAVFKYIDGQIALHSGYVDFKNTRPWGNWDRITKDQLPSFYKVGADVNDK